ncbi:MAG: hypothetical protein LC789_13390 [Actinobacteria bacterium]|nr:hypothetical protein [Actinomycetota bacterium]
MPADTAEARLAAGQERLLPGGWLLVAATPAAPGAAPIAAPDAVNWLRAAQQRLPAQPFSPQAPSVDRGRAVLSDSPDGGPSGDWRVELFADGGCFTAVRLEDPPQDGAPTVFAQEQVENWLVQLVGLAADHAAATGAGGPLRLAASVAATPPGTAGAVLGAEGRPLPRTRLVTAPTPALGLAEPGAPARSVVAASAGLASDIAAEFGAPLPAVLRPDGTVDAAAATPATARLLAWAASA